MFTIIWMSRYIYGTLLIYSNLAIISYVKILVLYLFLYCVTKWRYYAFWIQTSHIIDKIETAVIMSFVKLEIYENH